MVFCSSCDGIPLKFKKKNFRVSPVYEDRLFELSIDPCQNIRPRRTLFCWVSDPTGKLRPLRIRRKSFESLPFSLKGHFLKIICIYELRYPRLIVSMLKEPPILKMVFCSAGYDTPRNHFRIRISRRIRNGNKKYFRAWIRGPYRVNSWKKPEAKNLVLLYL